MYYILITTDKETISGLKISAFDIVSERLKIGKWPLYKGTNYLNGIEDGARCLIYIAGKKTFCQNIIAEIKINKITNLIRNNDYEEKLFDILSVPALKVLEFNPCKINTNKSVNIKKEMKNIDFIPKNAKKWGVLFMGGVKKIDIKDYTYLSNKLL